MDNEKKQVTYNSSITGETQVTFDIQQYMNNRASTASIRNQYCIGNGAYQVWFGGDSV